MSQPTTMAETTNAGERGQAEAQAALRVVAQQHREHGRHQGREQHEVQQVAGHLRSLWLAAHGGVEGVEDDEDVQQPGHLGERVAVLVGHGDDLPGLEPQSRGPGSTAGRSPSGPGCAAMARGSSRPRYGCRRASWATPSRKSVADRAQEESALGRAPQVEVAGAGHQPGQEAGGYGRRRARGDDHLGCLGQPCLRQRRAMRESPILARACGPLSR